MGRWHSVRRTTPDADYSCPRCWTAWWPYDGILDAEAGATLTTALQPFLVPTDPTDDRDTAQRRADGLVELAHLAMSQGQLPVTGGSNRSYQY